MTSPQILNIDIIKGAICEEYIYIPDPAQPTIGKDLTSATLQAQLTTNGTLLATFTCSLAAPPNIHNTQGWVKLRLDNTVTSALTSGVYRASWSLLASYDTDNPELIAAGMANILPNATSWT